MASEMQPTQGNAAGAVSAGAQSGSIAGPIGSVIGGMVGAIANRVQEQRNNEYRKKALEEQRNAESTAFSRANVDIMRTGVDPRVAGSTPQAAGSSPIAPTQSTLSSGILGGMEVGGSVGNSSANTAIAQSQFEESQRQFEWNQTNKVFDSMRTTLTDSLANAHDGKKFYTEQIQTALVRAGVNESRVKGRTDNFTHTYRKERQDIIDKIAREKYGFGIGLDLTASKGSTKETGSTNNFGRGSQRGSSRDSRTDERKGKKTSVQDINGSYKHGKTNVTRHNNDESRKTSQVVDLEDEDGTVFDMTRPEHTKFDTKGRKEISSIDSGVDYHDSLGTIMDEEESTTKGKLESLFDKVSDSSDFARSAMKSAKAFISGGLNAHFDYENLSEEDKREVDSHMNEWISGWVTNNVDTDTKLDDATRSSLLAYLEEFGRQYHLYADDEDYYKSARDYLYYDMRDFNDEISRYRSRRPRHRNVDVSASN